jgi:hypothetical protein
MSQTNNTVSPIGSDALVLPLRVIDLDSPFFWGVGRDMTPDERRNAENHGRYDNPPMSVLGVTREGLAAVEGKDLAQMFAAAPLMLEAINYVLEHPVTFVDNTVAAMLENARDTALGQNR